MAKGRLSIFLCVLAMSVGMGSASPRAAGPHECAGIPSDAVTTLPAPLRKWAQIACTPYGETVGSRNGWIWASLDDTQRVLIPSGDPQGSHDPVANENAYFTAIDVNELERQDRAFALSIFQDGLDFKDASPKVYRVDLTSVMGRVNTFFFFDFDNFAGGMWCPDGGCVPESRFLIMEQDEEAKPRPPSI
jgi:hypothetical protein